MEAHAESPRAGVSEWSHFVHVTRALTATEFKLRYFGSVLGYLWTVLRPETGWGEMTRAGFGEPVPAIAPGISSPADG